MRGGHLELMCQALEERQADLAGEDRGSNLRGKHHGLVRRFRARALHQPIPFALRLTRESFG